MRLDQDHPGDDGEGFLSITAYHDYDEDGNVKGGPYAGPVTTNGRTGQHYRTDGLVGTYGYMEARVKFNNEPGAFSAFLDPRKRLLPFGDPSASGLEIDIAEHVHPDVACGNGSPRGDAMGMGLHWDGYAEDHKTTGATCGSPTSTLPTSGPTSRSPSGMVPEAVSCGGKGG